MNSPAYEPFRRMRASSAYRCFITAIHVLLMVAAIGGLIRLLSAVHAPRVLYAPLVAPVIAIGVLAALTYVVSMIALVVIGRRWGGGSGIHVSGQIEFTRMVLDDLRRPLSWPSRRYDRWG